MATLESAHDLLGAEIKDLYSAEKQLTTAIPKMIAGAKSADLKAALTAHLDETRQQITRLETIAGILEIEASGQLCRAMECIIAEGSEALSSEAPAAVYDLGILTAARRVEHYEIAGYTTAISLAEVLQLNEVTTLLRETLFEENGAEVSLQGQVAGLLAASILSEAGPRKSRSSRAHNGMAKTA